MNNVHICSFDACPLVNRATRYEDFRTAVLKVGRFSTFEASANQYSQALYTRLCEDPTIETSRNPPGFPWTAVREKEVGK